MAPRVRKIKAHAPDYFLAATVLVLIIFGLVMLASASSDLGQRKFGDAYYYLKRQILYGLTFGLAGFFVCSRLICYRNLKKISLPLFLLGLAMLVLVFTPLGVDSRGVERWIAVGPFTLQPGEFIKLFFLMYLAAWLSGPEDRFRSWTEGFLPFILFLAVISLLLILQPSTSTAVIILLASFALYFFGGVKKRFILAGFLLGLLVLSYVVFITPYRLQRITTFLNPSSDTLGSGYHLNQSLIAIGSGGLFGVGYGQSTTKINYLPEPVGDSIFSVIAEELGFVGAAGLIIIFLLFVIRSFMIARKVDDLFGKYLTVGFASLIGFQAFVHIGAAVGLIPFTGVPLPFVSFGGTALAVFLTMSGIIINVSRYTSL